MWRQTALRFRSKLKSRILCASPFSSLWTFASLRWWAKLLSTWCNSQETKRCLTKWPDTKSTKTTNSSPLVSRSRFTKSQDAFWFVWLSKALDLTSKTSTTIMLSFMNSTKTTSLLFKNWPNANHQFLRSPKYSTGLIADWLWPASWVTWNFSTVSNSKAKDLGTTKSLSNLNQLVRTNNSVVSTCTTTCSTTSWGTPQTLLSRLTWALASLLFQSSP